MSNGAKRWFNDRGSSRVIYGTPPGRAGNHGNPPNVARTISMQICINTQDCFTSTHTTIETQLNKPTSYNSTQDSSCLSYSIRTSLANYNTILV